MKRILLLTIFLLLGACKTKTPSTSLFLLATQWIPGWCAIPNDAVRASAILNDTVCTSNNPELMYHGLWPQFTNGTYPQSCHQASPLNQKLLSFVNPYRGYLKNFAEFIDHEWGKHGTCSNFYENSAGSALYYSGVNSYFSTGISIFNSFTMPALSGEKTGAQVQDSVAASNSSIGVIKNSIIVKCSADQKNNYHFTGLWFCINPESLEFEACPSALVVDDCASKLLLIDQFGRNG